MIQQSAIYEPPVRHWKLGDQILTGGRTVDSGTIAWFAALAANYDRLHIDAQFMADSRFGERIAHGSLTYALACGLLRGAGYNVEDLGQVTSIRTLRPVHSGDTIRVVGSVGAISECGETITAASFLVKNQRGEDVMEFVQAST